MQQLDPSDDTGGAGGAYSSFPFDEVYQDTGCRLHTSCLDCPFPKCAEEYASVEIAIRDYWRQGCRQESLWESYWGFHKSVPADVLAAHGIDPDAKRTALSRRFFPQESRDEIAVLLAEGERSFEDIARQYHCSIAIVIEIQKRLKEKAA